MPRKLVVCLDGCSPEYIAKSDTPFLDELGRRGFSTVGQSIVPTVTNVNNVSIVTASYPAEHGITANFYRDENTGEDVYMESPQYLLRPTVFQQAEKRGLCTALLTAKDKLRTLLSSGATISLSAESPPPWLVEKLGPPPAIYSLEVNHWLFQAAREVLPCHRPDILYLTTTDYAMHRYGPEEELAQWNMQQLDQLLGDILNAAPDLEVVVTADHGMWPKTRALDLSKILGEAGIGAEAIPIIKDRYVVHHQNLGGAAYIYLKELGSACQAQAVLEQEPGVESIWPAEVAAQRFHLHPRRIGHLFVLATAEAVFGNLPVAREEVALRSHGSLHEQQVPIIGYGRDVASWQPTENKDALCWLWPEGIASASADNQPPN